MTLRMGRYHYQFPRPALVMGILNVTPDSFSDGGQFYDPAKAIAHGVELAAEGAEIIDVGGESSRPNAATVSETEELHRVIPVIEQLAKEIQVPISIDTQKPGVAKEALAAGASLVNDIATNREDDAMRNLVAETGAGYVAMHMRGTPQTMQNHPVYQDVVREIGWYFTDRLARLLSAGVHEHQVILDVGIGFGKSLDHNLDLLGRLKTYIKFQRPLLLGVSRKSFMGNLLGVEIAARLPAGLACACRARQAGVQIIRAHDVAATVQALRMTEAILAHAQ